MKTSKPLNDNAQWQRSDLQYPRLIAELLATGAFDTNVRTAICDSMDLEPHQLDELLRRAESDWTTIKQTILTSNKSASTLRCPHCNYNGKKPTDNGQGFRYLSDQTTWREVVKVERESFWSKDGPKSTMRTLRATNVWNVGPASQNSPSHPTYKQISADLRQIIHRTA